MVKNNKIVIRKLGESFRECTEIVNIPVPEPEPGEVLIRNHYAGVNAVYDQMMCLDRVEHTRMSPPADTGVEAVGEVVSVGMGVDDWCKGDAVATVRAGQGYRLYQCCSTDDAIPVPEISPEVLAIVPSGTSALVALEQVGEMSSGETICITAAAGGLGNLLTQLAIRADNKVIAVCGSDRKSDWLASAGVDRVINYQSESLADVLAHEYPDRLNLAMDSVGGKTFDALLRQLAPHGRLVVCGYTSDRLPTERHRHERVYSSLYWKAASVRGFMNYRFAEFAPSARKRLFDWMAAGEITPLVDGCEFKGLEDAANAVEYLLSGKNLGKVVLDLRNE